MFYFLDTSALVKRYRYEIGTHTIDKIFLEKAAEIMICSLSISEVASALNKHLRKKEISTNDFHKTLDRFYTDIRTQTIAILDIKQDAFFRANNLIFDYHLTSSDAIISGLLSAAIANHLSTLNPVSI